MKPRLGVIVAGALIGFAACGGGDDGSTPVDAHPDAPCVPTDDSNECTTDECIGGQPVHTPRPGETCTGGGRCDAQGTCAPPSCTNTVMDGTETGVDCGGSCAPAHTCGDGVGCMVAGDCTSGVCTGTPGTCQAARCGDGVMQAGEMCDDGNDTNGDGCDDGAGDACRSTGCGNGVVTGTEVCDDGNDVNGDGCDDNCTVSACGNGVTAGTETCDDGDTDPGDGCSAACTVEVGYMCSMTVPAVCAPVCGDSLIVGGEACDDGDTDPGDGCDAACMVEDGFTCSGTPSVCATVCGDAMIAGDEECDDGNDQSLDGCAADCTNDTAGVAEVEPNEDGTPQPGGGTTTGNDFDTGGLAVANATTQGVIMASGGNTLRIGALTPAGDEDVFAITNDLAGGATLRLDTWSRAAGFGLGVACGLSIDTVLQLRDAAGASLQVNDDRDVGTDRCSGLTRNLAAGQTVYAHVIEYGDNDPIDGYALQIGLTPIVCGDGQLAAGLEQCDDGDTDPGDGCSATCTVEPGWGCTATSPSVCTPNPYSSIALACTDMSSGTTTLSATGDDDLAPTTALPFAVTVYGTTYTHFAASTNGFVALLDSATAARPSSSHVTNDTLVPSNASPNGYLAPFWDDLVMTSPGMITKVSGNPGAQVFTVQWQGHPYLSDATMRFQLQLTEAGGVEFHYCEGTAGTDPGRSTGNSATIAVENADGTVGRAISINTANAVTWGTTAYRWNIP